MSYNEYDAVCARMAHPESTLTNPVVRVAAWTGWDGDKLRKEKRDAFIAAHGGKPIDVKKHSQLKYQQRMADFARIEARKSLIERHEWCNTWRQCDRGGKRLTLPAPIRQFV
jgi:hypothetical protein